MNRREGLVGLCIVLASGPSMAQQGQKVPRIGFLTLIFPEASPATEAFRSGLGELGRVVGRDVAIEHRFAQGRPEALDAMAAELVAMDVAAIVVESTVAARAAKRASDRVPIVLAVVGDPVGSGLVASPARPGANITGMTLQAVELSRKRLDLVTEPAPAAKRIGVFWNPGNPASRVYLRSTEEAAAALGLALAPVEVASPAALDTAFEAMTRARPDALVLVPEALFFANMARFVAFVRAARLPAVCPEPDYCPAGGLMAYGADLMANFHRAAAFVDRILDGARPGDLPLEPPARFVLLANRRTAGELGMEIPASILARADTVID